MGGITQVVVEAIQHTSLWEVLAVFSGIVYLLLAMRENNLCWYFAFFQTGIYTLLFWQVSLLMDSALNVYYMAMAVYGWWFWRRGGRSHTAASIRRWTLAYHGIAVLAIAIVSISSGYLLALYTEAAWPYVDSFTTWASVLTTWMVAQKILENWLYWLVIDSVSIALYVDRGLYFTALLFFIYVIIAIFGFVQWLNRYRERYGTQ